MDLDEDTLLLIPIYTSENKLSRFDLDFLTLEQQRDEKLNELLK
jgi:hypothetical protein